MPRGWRSKATILFPTYAEFADAAHREDQGRESHDKAYAHAVKHDARLAHEKGADI